MRGLVHDEAVPPSRRQVNGAPERVEWKVNVAEVLVVVAGGGVGALSMTVSGAGVAGGVVNEADALSGEELPAASFASTAYMCAEPAVTVMSVYEVTAPRLASFDPSR